MFNQRVGFWRRWDHDAYRVPHLRAQTYRYYAVYVPMVSFPISISSTRSSSAGAGRTRCCIFCLRRWRFIKDAHGVFAIASHRGLPGHHDGIAPRLAECRAFFTLVGVQLVLLILIAPALWQYFLRDFLATQQIASVVGAVPDSEVGMGWL
ncbi:MAG: hypothetical protein IPK19_10210, partial [Chloroflexi bacterium]|nr:hypothetical protein [Chloroflexota bacterium]